MPFVNGLELLPLLRRKHGNVPAIAVTAHAQAAYRDRTAEAGFQAHLVKPVIPDELLLQLRRLSGGQNCATLAHLYCFEQ